MRISCHGCLWLIGISSWPISALFATTYTVSTNSDSGAGSFRQAITDVNSAGAGTHTIAFNASLGTITLSSDLPPITNSSATSIAITGNSNVVDGASAYAALMVGSSASTVTGVTISSLTVQNANAVGGNGGGTNSGTVGGCGGGGLGAGGGIFVNGSVTLSSGTISNCTATGGNGTSANGGGVGGNGGGGASFNTVAKIGGAASSGSGATGGGDNGGTGGGSGAAGNTGTVGGGGGGGGSATAPTSGGAGGGGGFGGGGGGGGKKVTGPAGSSGAGGGGGFGGGGGGSGSVGTGGVGAAGSAGTYGGAGEIGSGSNTGRGGGGAGIGGCAFVYTSSTLTLDGMTISGGAANPGTGANSGQGVAPGIYLYGSAILKLKGTMTLSTVITGESGTPDSGVQIESGTVTISGTNAYYGGTTFTGGTAIITADLNLGDATGTLTFNGGTLQVGNTITSSRQTTLSGAGTISVTDSNVYTFSGQVGSTGSLTKSGTGTLILGSAGNNYSGGTTLNGGILQIGLNANLGDTSANLNVTGSSTLKISATIAAMARAMPISASQTLTIDTNTFDLTSSGVISGASGALTKSSAGTLTLSGANTYGGVTTVNAGTLKAGIANAFSSSSTVTMADVASAILDLNSLSQTIANLSGGGTTGGTVSLGSATLTLGNSSDATYGGAISGTGGAIVKQGSGKWTLTSSASAYTGGTTLAAGTLNINNNANLGNSSTALTVTGTSTLQLGATIASMARNMPISASQTLTIDTNTFDLTHSGIISGASGALIKSSTGTLTLSGVNTYGGGTTINGGTLALFDLGKLSTTGSVNLNASTAIFAFNDANTNITIGDLSGVASSIVNTGTNILTVGTANDATFSGSFQGMVGSTGIYKQGSGKWTLTGDSSAYIGGFGLAAGTLNINSDTNLGESLYGIEVTGNGTLQLNASITTMARVIPISANRTLTIDTNGFNLTNAQAISGASGSLTKIGTGILTLSYASSTYGGATTVSAGTLRAGVASSFSSSSAVTMADVASAILDLNSFNQTIANLSGGGTTGGNVSLGSATLTLGNSSSTTYSGAITGTGGVTKQGSGTFQLAQANNTYSGTTTVNAGTFQAGIAGGFSSSSAVTMANVASAVLDLNSFSQTIANLSGGGTTGGNVSLGSATLTVGNSSSTTYSGAITGAGGVTKQGSGTFQLAQANNTYSGTTTVNAGTFQAGIAGGFSSSSAVTMANVASAVLDLNSFSQTIANLSGGGTTGGNVSLGSATLTVGNSSDTTYAGVISGTGGVLYKQGSGKLTLTGANTYSGSTTVAAGTLQGNATSLQGAISNAAAVIWNQTTDGTYAGATTGAGTMTVQGGGELTMSGTIGQSTITVASGGILAIDGAATLTTLTVASGGSLLGSGSATATVNVNGDFSGGHDVGTFTVTGTYNQNAGSRFIVDLPTSTTVDLLDITGAATINGSPTFYLRPGLGNYPANSTYTVMSATGGITGGGFADPVVSELPAFDAYLKYIPLTSPHFLFESLLGDGPITAVQLIVNLVPFANLALGSAANKVAQCFDSIANNSLQDYVLLMSLAQIENTFLQMSPALFSDLDLSQQSALTQVRESVSREMNLLLRTPCGAEHRYQVWSDLFVLRSSQKSKSARPGYYSGDVGETIGMDYQMASGSFAGCFFSHINNHLSWKNNQGDARINNFYTGLYGGGWLVSDLFYAQGSILGSYDHYRTRRTVYFQGTPGAYEPFNLHPKARFFGFDGMGSFEMGVIGKKHTEQARTAQDRLYVKTDYSCIWRKQFQEKNAQSINLAVNSHFSDFVRVEAGNDIAYCIPVGQSRITPHLAFGGIYDYQIHGKVQKAEFIPSPCTMYMDGLEFRRGLLFAEIGILGQLKGDHLNVIGNFRGEYGSEYVSHNWSAELKCAF